MSIVNGILVVLHLIGWAMVLGSALANMRNPQVAKGMLHGVLTALISGILIVGLAEMGDGTVNHVKIGVKLLITLVVTAMVILGQRDEKKVTAGYLGGIAGLVVVNVAIAVLWGSPHV